MIKLFRWDSLYGIFGIFLAVVHVILIGSYLLAERDRLHLSFSLLVLLLRLEDRWICVLICNLPN
jgi:hypothetical protein